MHLFASLLLYHSLAGLLPRSFFRVGLGLTVALIELGTISAFLIWDSPGLHQLSFAALCVLTTLILFYRIKCLGGDSTRAGLRRNYLTGMGEPARCCLRFADVCSHFHCGVCTMASRFPDV